MSIIRVRKYSWSSQGPDSSHVHGVPNNLCFATMVHDDVH